MFPLFLRLSTVSFRTPPNCGPSCSFTLLIHELAQNDYEIALTWYLKKSLEAANNFIIKIENTIELICDNPKRWRNEYKHFRELGLKKILTL